MCLKRKTNKPEPMSDIRRAILMYVPAEVRMKIYGERHSKKRKSKIIWMLTKLYAILIGCMILEYVLENDPFWYGYFLGVGILTLMLVWIAYIRLGEEWRPPSNEEMNELGDELI